MLAGVWPSVASSSSISARFAANSAIGVGWRISCSLPPRSFSSRGKRDADADDELSCPTGDSRSAASSASALALAASANAAASSALAHSTFASLTASSAAAFCALAASAAPPEGGAPAVAPALPAASSAATFSAAAVSAWFTAAAFCAATRCAASHSCPARCASSLTRRRSTSSTWAAAAEGISTCTAPQAYDPQSNRGIDPQPNRDGGQREREHGR